MIEHSIYWIKKFYGEKPEESDSYSRIINEKHFDRIIGLMKDEEIIFGGNSIKKELYISPTILEVETLNRPIMEEEIFGPLLPILTYEKIDKVFDIIRNRKNPLSLYYFGNSKQQQEKIIKYLNFGGGCINDSILHVANINLPFGGIGSSGMGKYHGKASFDTFSHEKSILKKSRFFDLELRYPPYTDKKLSLIKKLFK